jgi:hypothetical protein
VEDEGVAIPLSLGGIEDPTVEFRADDSGESVAMAGDPDTDLLDGEGVFTGLRMQRLTCLFRLDATPKRRPQVSQTNAIKGDQVSGQNSITRRTGETYLFLRCVRGDARDKEPKSFREYSHQQK